MIKIAVLISGTGSNAKAITDKCLSGEINAEVVCFGSDKSDAKGLEYAREKGISTFVVDYKTLIKDYNANPQEFVLPNDFDYDFVNERIDFVPVADRERYIKTRAAAEAAVLEKISEHKPDLLVLAGFMRTLTPYFIDKFSPDSFNPKIMNIHPALLPSFPGVDGYGDTYFYGSKKGGCTVHFVDYGTDSGPIIVQKSFDICSDDSLEDVKKKGLELEWQAYPEAVSLFADNALEIKELSRTLKNGDVEKRKIVFVKK